ncbi:MAG: hypothetical protein IPN42_08410 [Methylococcaceae bacterium]|nr:hypothetical protein [Methylococcaceae bacterium]
MNWQPVSESELLDMLNHAENRMTIDQLRLWEIIKIEPEKWQQHPFGNEGDGFWVVGILGQLVIWFNDIEYGFNVSRYKQYGSIDQYWCNQDKLEWTVQSLLNMIEHGYSLSPKLSSPVKI